jgi:hypothetical protein
VRHALCQTPIRAQDLHWSPNPPRRGGGSEQVLPQGRRDPLWVDAVMEVWWQQRVALLNTGRIVEEVTAA